MISQRIGNAGVTIISVCGGNAIGWTSPIMGRLQGKTGSYKPMDSPITDFQSSWISSSLLIGSIFGSFCGGICLQKFGRKTSLLMMGGPPAIIGWVFILTAGNFETLLAARFIIGVSYSSSLLLLQVYLAEVSSASLRGTLGSMHQLMVNLGTLVQYAVGPYVSYHALAAFNLAFPVIFTVVFFFMPESPYYLVAVGKREEAEESLAWLRGGSKSGVCVDVREELNSITKVVEETGIRDSSLRNGLRQLFFSRGNRRALFATIGLMINFQLSGFFPVFFNAESIFRGSITERPILDASESAIVIAVVQLVASLFAAALADQAGRKPLLAISSGFVSICLVVLGIYSYLETHYNSLTANISWVPIVALVMYITFLCLGLGVFPWVVMGELFPSDVKGVATIVCGSCNWFTGFIIAVSFQWLLDVTGYYGIYWFYAASCAAGVLFTLLFVPETKCKTLEEIQYALNKK
ncbi:hypothetical protein J437_LFUL017625 [Ladona fulva]|uniref:Major facilitator superfamily (MFS) profile domain-containing protein n=1 Tax=Ladona fulva TaxID=123851 RepID=A0A8K0P2J7_LADFU|nr:hypothetical protein J437_LFUL017625 [Ladona fulva]